MKNYKCLNIGNCEYANEGTKFEIAEGEEVKCPKCGCSQDMLVEIVTRPWGKIAAVAVAVAAVLGGGAVGVSQLLNKPGDTTVVDTVAVPPVSVDDPDTLAAPEPVLIEELTVSDSELALKEGEKKQLTLTVVPEENEDNIVVSSSDEAVVTISDTYEVVAVKAGKATITFEAEKAGVKAEVAVDVAKKADPTSGPYSLGWGTYSGPMSGGKPNGIGGEITVTKTYTIDLKKASGETVTVNRGDKIANVKMENGRLRQGEIRFADGTRKFVSGL